MELDPLLMSALRARQLALYIGSGLGPEELRGVHRWELSEVLTQGAPPAAKRETAIRRLQEIAARWEQRSHPELDLAAKLPIDVVITSNMDRALLAAYQRTGRSVRLYPDRPVVAGARELELIPLMGLAHAPSTLDQAVSGTAPEQRSLHLSARVTELLNSHLVVCLGYGPLDITFRDSVLEAARSQALVHRVVYLVGSTPALLRDWAVVGDGARDLPMEPRELLESMAERLRAPPPEHDGSQAQVRDAHGLSAPPSSPDLSLESAQGLERMVLFAHLTVDGLAVVEYPDGMEGAWVYERYLKDSFSSLTPEVVDIAALPYGTHLQEWISQRSPGHPLVLLGLERLVGKLPGQQRRVMFEINQLRERLVRGVVILVIPRLVGDLMHQYARDLLDWSTVRVELKFDATPAERSRGGPALAMRHVRSSKGETEDAAPSTKPSPSEMRHMRELAADMVPWSVEIQMMLVDAHLDRRRVDLAGSPDSIWFEVLNFAWGQGNAAFVRLLKVLSARYPAFGDDPTVKSVLSRLGVPPTS